MKEPHIIRRYAALQSIHYLALGIMLPIMVMLQLSRGLSLSQVGYVMACYGLTVILLEIPTGGLADLIGRKRVYIISQLLSFTAYTILFFSSDMTLVLIAFIIYGSSRALGSGSLDAWFVDTLGESHTDQEVQKALGYIEIAILAGLGAGSLLGGYLAGFQTQRAYTANIAAAAACVLITCLTALLLIHERDLVQQEQRKTLTGQISSSIHTVFRSRALLLLILSTVFLGLGLSSMETLWQPRVAQIFDISSSSWILGLLSAGYFFSAAAGAYLVSRQVGRIHRHNHLLLAFSRLAFGLMFIIISRVNGIAGFACCYFLLFFFNGSSSSPYTAMLNSHTPSEKRSTILSISSFALQIGGAAGSAAAGAAAQRFSISWVWFFVGTALCLSSLLFLPLRSTYRSKGQGAERGSVS